jgi:UDP-N-acetylglucosamine 2-epimerase (non-hydrolysing)/GDP/UDP-N,N'-diacetylbacillosamine 2-epimerase (hydrolysing)
MTRKIAVITGSRADYGLLYHPIKAIDDSSELELCLMVCGMHLDEKYGSTWKKIEEDGFEISEKVEMPMEDDSEVSVCKSMAAGVSGFAEAFERQNPDYVLFLGDRYEILSVAQVALVMKIPMIHLCGGDITEGAFDDSIRHSLTKLSSIHFPTNELSKKRIIQLGEDPDNVHCVGSTGIDSILSTELMGKEELESSLDFKFKKHNILVTFHATTLGEMDTMSSVEELLTAIDGLGEDWGVIFTKANADTDGEKINNRLVEYTSNNKSAVLHDSLGQLRYYSALNYVDAMVGNSSSGLYEAPVFKTPTVNIGDRQKGRLSAESVIDCGINSNLIADAIKKSVDFDCSGVVSPYGDGRSTPRIMDVLNNLPSPENFRQKKFRLSEN